MNNTYIEVYQMKSIIGQSRQVKKIVFGLGLNNIGSHKKFRNSPSIRGMILKIQHLLIIKIIKIEADLNV